MTESAESEIGRPLSLHSEVAQPQMRMTETPKPIAGKNRKTQPISVWAHDKEIIKKWQRAVRSGIHHVLTAYELSQEAAQQAHINTVDFQDDIRRAILHAGLDEDVLAQGREEARRLENIGETALSIIIQRQSNLTEHPNV